MEVDRRNQIIHHISLLFIALQELSLSMSLIMWALYCIMQAASPWWTKWKSKLRSIQPSQSGATCLDAEKKSLIAKKSPTISRYSDRTLQLRYMEFERWTNVWICWQHLLTFFIIHQNYRPYVTEWLSDRLTEPLQDAASSHFYIPCIILFFCHWTIISFLFFVIFILGINWNYLPGPSDDLASKTS